MMIFWRVLYDKLVDISSDFFCDEITTYVYYHVELSQALHGGFLTWGYPVLSPVMTSNQYFCILTNSDKTTIQSDLTVAL